MKNERLNLCDALAHKLLNANDLPQGALARYERDIAAIATLMRRWEVKSFSSFPPKSPIQE